MSAVHPGGSVLLALVHDDEGGSIAFFFLPCKSGRGGAERMGNG